MKNLPTSEEVITAMRDSGWLLEQDSARLLERHGFRTIMGWAYADPHDASTSRELDVFGYRQFLKSDTLRLFVSGRVLIECKQSMKPYVIVGREIPEQLRQRQPTEHILRYQYLVTGRTPAGKYQRIETVPAWTHLGLNSMPGSPSRYPFRGTQLTRLDRQKTWTADNRGVFTSLVYPLAKALRAAQSGIKTTDTATVEARKDDSWTEVALNFPIVVTSAPLFVVDATTDELEAKLEGWSTVTRQLRASGVEGVFTIDVCTYSALDAYMTERVIAFSNAVAQAAEARPESFISPSAK